MSPKSPTVVPKRISVFSTTGVAAPLAAAPEAAGVCAVLDCPPQAPNANAITPAKESLKRECIVFMKCSKK